MSGGGDAAMRVEGDTWDGPSLSTQAAEWGQAHPGHQAKCPGRNGGGAPRPSQLKPDARLGAGPPAPEFRLDELVEVPVEHRFDVAGLHPGPHVLDQLEGRQRVGPDLAAPGVVGTLALVR